MTKHRTLFSIHAFGGMTANERRLGRFLRDGAGHPDPAPAPAGEGKSDDFDAAFDAAAAALEPEAPPAAAAAAPAPADDAGVGGDVPAGGEPAAVPGGDAGGDGGGEPAAAPVVAGGTTPPAAPAPAAAEPAAPQLSAEEVLNRLAGMVGEKPAAPEAPQAPEAQAPIYTDDEIAQLTEYEKNWPDVAAAEQIRRKGEYHDLLKYVFAQVHAYVNPLQDQLRSIGNNLHLGELKQAVPDYSENLEQDVNNWIGTQPTYLQPAYNHVMQSGTSDEVADLIGRYRAATGAAQAPAQPAAPAAAAPATPTATPAVAPKTELSSAAKQAAESLAPVSGERSVVPQGEDVQDFDSAFAKYAATMPGF